MDLYVYKHLCFLYSFINISGIAVGLNHGHKVTPREVAPKVSHRKGRISKRTELVRDLVREVTGYSPYERRLVELLRNSQEKRARKLAKTKLGSMRRAKRLLWMRDSHYYFVLHLPHV